MAIDPDLNESGRFGNLDLVRSTAEEALPHLRDRSIRVANADHFINVLTPYNAAQFLVKMKDKLWPNARLYVTHQKRDFKDVRLAVESAGFSISEPKPLEGSGLPIPPSARYQIELREIAKAMANGEWVECDPHARQDAYYHRNNPEGLTPMRFVARPEKQE